VELDEGKIKCRRSSLNIYVGAIQKVSHIDVEMELFIIIMLFIVLLIMGAIRESSSYHSVITKIYRSLKEYKNRGVKPSPYMIEKYLDYYLRFRQEGEEEEEDN
jgi:hypothetical protein